METLAAFVLAGAITMVFVRGYLKKLTDSKTAVAPPAILPQRACPRCGNSVEQTASFCPHCGAAMALWTVHNSPVQGAAAGNSATGRVTPVINASMCIGCGSCVHVCPESGTLELAGGKAFLAHPERCVGHAKCAEVCPTQAISLSVGGVLQTARVPLVDEHFETNMPGVFIVGELGGMGLIKTAINEGKLVIDHIGARWKKHSANQGDGVYDVAIVGAGPAGLSASLAAQQLGMRYITLEQGEIASTIRQYPRQKFLTAEPIQMPLYGTLYVADSTKESLLAVWETIISSTGVCINTNERVESVSTDSSGFRVKTAKADYRARFVVLAMGKRGTPRRLGVLGENLAKVSYRLIEAGTYRERNVLVVGGGDSAIEAALALSRVDGNRVTLCHRKGTFDRARQRNQDQLQQAEQEHRILVLLNSRVEEIADDFVTLDNNGHSRTLPNDFVFVMAGGESPEEFLLKTGVEIVEKAIGVVTFG